MRRPTPYSVLYAGWRAMLAAQAQGRARTGQSLANDWEPGCGWYVTTWVKGGPPVPARVWRECDLDPETNELADDERLIFELGGERRRSFPVKLIFHATTEAEFDRLTAERRGNLRLLATHAPMSLTDEPHRPRRD